jgi:hypothetical protein
VVCSTEMTVRKNQASRGGRPLSSVTVPSQLSGLFIPTLNKDTMCLHYRGSLVTTLEVGSDGHLQLHHLPLY